MYANSLVIGISENIKGMENEEYEIKLSNRYFRQYQGHGKRKV